MTQHRYICRRNESTYNTGSEAGQGVGGGEASTLLIKKSFMIILAEQFYPSKKFFSISDLLPESNLKSLLQKTGVRLKK